MFWEEMHRKTILRETGFEKTSKHYEKWKWGGGWFTRENKREEEFKTTITRPKSTGWKEHNSFAKAAFGDLFALLHFVLDNEKRVSFKFRHSWMLVAPVPTPIHRSRYSFQKSPWLFPASAPAPALASALEASGTWTNNTGSHLHSQEANLSPPGQEAALPEAVSNWAQSQARLSSKIRSKIPVGAPSSPVPGSWGSSNLRIRTSLHNSHSALLSRSPGYLHTQAGLYYVTLCLQYWTALLRADRPKTWISWSTQMCSTPRSPSAFRLWISIKPHSIWLEWLKEATSESLSSVKWIWTMHSYHSYIWMIHKWISRWPFREGTDIWLEEEQREAIDIRLMRINSLMRDDRGSLVALVTFSSGYCKRSWLSPVLQRDPTPFYFLY